MKKLAIILACMLICAILFVGCTNQNGGNNQNTDLGNSVEIDDTDIDAERKPDTEDDSDNVTLPDGITYDFKDPENADGIVVTPKE